MSWIISGPRWPFCFKELPEAILLIDQNNTSPAVRYVPDRGECRWVLVHSGTLYDKWSCSKCGFLFVESRCDRGATELEPNYCPLCGARVVG